MDAQLRGEGHARGKEEDEIEGVKHQCYHRVVDLGEQPWDAGSWHEIQKADQSKARCEDCIIHPRR